MTGFAALVAEQRRRVLLEVMLTAPGNRANDAVLRAVVERRVELSDRTLIRADLSYLELHALVTIDKLSDGVRDVWVGVLTDAGAAVARGRQHQGIADRELG